VAIAYIVMAWLVLQVADVVLNNISAPDWLFLVILLLLGIGLLLAIFFAWAFELTPEGIKREHQVDRSKSITPTTGRKLNNLTIFLMALAIGYFAYDKFVLSDQRNEEAVEATLQAQSDHAEKLPADTEADKSIAVLPFVNLSSDPEQEYFSDGISEELLNVLAKIPGLHVTSRSSAFAFKGKEISIPEVASRLGVAHILEGSVRKSGTKIRITAQLIEAQSDKHLWSETYDRNLDDVFAIQDEISAAIVSELMSRLNFEVETPSHAASKNDVSPEAYRSYLLAQHELNKRTLEGYMQAKTLLLQTVEQDPKFAPAYAALARSWLLESSGYGDGSVSTQQAIAEATPLINEALRLDPYESNAYAARGLVALFDGDALGTIEPLQAALEINPSNSDARNWLSLGYRALLRSQDELETLIEGHRRDPLKEAIATNLVKSLSRFGQYEEANAVLANLEDLGLSDYSFSLTEAQTLRGRYAKSVETALRGEEADGGSFVLLYMAAYLLAAMGEPVEAERLDPWQGGYDEFSAMLNMELRDPQARLEKIRQIETHSEEPEVKEYLVWAELGALEFAAAEKLALKNLDIIKPGNREIDTLSIVLGLIEWNKGNPEKALAYLDTWSSRTAQNIAVGDTFALNHLVQAIVQFMRGNDLSTYSHLQAAFDSKAPTSFEGVNVFVVYRALGWDRDPGYAALLAEFEAKNTKELHVVFDQACNGTGYTVWTPLPASCEKYASQVGISSGSGS
jgi:TolB-like protein